MRFWTANLFAWTMRVATGGIYFSAVAPSPRFYAFDLLWLNGKDLRQLPLIERKKHLRHLIGGE